MQSGEDFLFSESTLDDALENAKRRMQKEILDAPEEYLLNVDLDEWVGHLVLKYQSEPIGLKRDEMFFEDLGESHVDVRYDHGLRAIFDMSQPVYVAGRA